MHISSIPYNTKEELCRNIDIVAVVGYLKRLHMKIQMKK